MSEQVQSAVGSGHISLDVTVNAKGDYQYTAKVVLPFPALEAITLVTAVEDVRLLAQEQLEAAETFLKERYGRASS